MFLECAGKRKLKTERSAGENMLHIILGILKIIGIIIGLLFLLLICMMLAILFVPVRYRGKLVRKEEILQGEIRISWFLRTVCAAVSVGIGEKLSLEVRLFGIRLPFGKGGSGRGGTGGRKKRSARKNSGNTTARKKAGTGRNKPESDRSTGEPDTQGEAGDEKAAIKTAERAEKSDLMPAEYTEEPEPMLIEHTEKSDWMPVENAEEPEPTPVEYIEKPDLMPVEYIEESEPTEHTEEMDRKITEYTKKGVDAVPESEEIESEHDRTEKEATEEHGIFRKVAGIFRKLKQIAERVLQKFKNIYELCVSLAEKAEHLSEKLKKLLQKPEQLLSLIQEYEVREIMSHLFGHLKYLLCHYGLRRIEGYLKFGTADPALTGQLTGLIYLLLPAKADRFTLTPDFYEACFETEIIFSGHIRSCHMLRVAWGAFRDRKLRRLIRKLRKRGE